jgi:hypothetical protein
MPMLVRRTLSIDSFFVRVSNQTPHSPTRVTLLENRIAATLHPVYPVSVMAEFEAERLESGEIIAPMTAGEYA